MKMEIIETFKLEDSKVHKLALETTNERMTREDLTARVSMPRLKYLQDFRRRVLTGGALTFLEAKYMVREMLTFDKWKIDFYEVPQFRKVVFFETEFQALKYYKRATLYGKGATGGKLMPQRMELYSPAEHIYGERREINSWKAPDYKPDAMLAGGYR